MRSNRKWMYQFHYNLIIKPAQPMSRLMTKLTKRHVRPAKPQISLGSRPVWSESLLCAQWVAKDPSFLHAESEDSDQTGQMLRLIWVFAGRSCHFVGFCQILLLRPCSESPELFCSLVRACSHTWCTKHPWRYIFTKKLFRVPIL